MKNKLNNIWQQFRHDTKIIKVIPPYSKNFYKKKLKNKSFNIKMN